MKTHYLLPLLLTLLCSCGRPGHPSQERPDFLPDEEANRELLNRTTRFTSSSLTLNYDEGGILVSYTPDGIMMYDLTGGHDITFTAPYIEEGELTRPRLTVDGHSVSLQRGICLRKSERGCLTIVQPSAIAS